MIQNREPIEVYSNELIDALREKVFNSNDPPVVGIETGTYLGTGSTRAILEAHYGSRMKDFPFHLHTIEGNKAAYTTAKGHLKDEKRVTVYHALTLSRRIINNFILNDTFLLEEDKYPQILKDWVDGADPRRVYISEVSEGCTGKGIPENLLPQLIEKYKDQKILFFLDSCGGMGYLEFLTVWKEMGDREYYLCTDDINHVKHYRTMKLIEGNEDGKWQILWTNARVVIAKHLSAPATGVFMDQEVIKRMLEVNSEKTIAQKDFPTTDVFMAQEAIKNVLKGSPERAIVQKSLPKLSVIMLAMQQIKITKDCLWWLRKTTAKYQIELIAIVNGKFPDMVTTIEEVMTGVDVTIIVNNNNRGFIIPNNIAINYARGEYFILLNNDLYLHDGAWFDKALEKLQDPNVAFVGFLGGTCFLRHNTGYGRGPVPQELNKREPEFIEGSALIGRTKDVLKYGLFSNEYLNCYYEDSDMALRYKQMGKKLELIETQFNHVRQAEANLLPNGFVSQSLEHNKSIFLKRWGQYLMKRKFHNRIVVRMASLGGGDILCMTPALEGLRKDHPTAEIIVKTDWPDVFVGNPYVNEVWEADRDHGEKIDRYEDIMPNYSGPETIAKMTCDQLGTKPKSYRPQFFLTDMEKEVARALVEKKNSKDLPVVVCSLLMDRIDWQGRNYVLDKVAKIVYSLKENGYFVIEVGKNIQSSKKANMDLVNQTTFRELAAIIYQCDYFIGIDSLPIHFAQAFSKPIVGLFGATMPFSRLVSRHHVKIVQQTHLPCIYCYHKRGINDINKCQIKEKEKCMTTLSPYQVIQAFLELAEEVKNAKA